jgi:hypothetical protein
LLLDVDHLVKKKLYKKGLSKISLKFSVVTIDSKNNSIIISHPENSKEAKTFSYDHVYDERFLLFN